MSSAVQVVERHQRAVTVPVGADGVATASCASGEQLLGGGYELSTGGTVPFASFPSAANTWTVRVHPRTGGPLQLTAFADCLQAPFDVGATIVTGASDTGNPPPSTHVEANTAAECPSGTTLTGGGFQLTGDDNGYVWDLRPSHNPALWNAWVAIGFVLTGPITVTPYAVCARTHLSNPPDPHPSFPFTIPAMRNAASSASCPSGQVLTAGGYWDDTEAHALTSQPVYADTDAPHVEPGHDGAALAPWRVRGSNLTDFDHTELIWLVCLVVAEPSAAGTPSPAATTPSPTATPTTAAAPPTATTSTAPVVVFGAGPLFFTQTCQSSFTVLSPLQVQLNNQRSTVPVTWSASITEMVGTSGHLWASASPSSGSVAAGATQALTITPESGICNDSQNVVPDATYHARLTFSPPDSLGDTITISDTVHSPIPG
jgi:hypothetical protein